MNYERSETIAELVKALVAAQAVMGAAAKDKLNPHFGSKYADLGSCLDACRKPLTDNGLAIMQPPSAIGASVTVSTVLMHISGEWISSDMTITAEKATAQGLGSALSYARRYSLSSMIGLGAEDDDGNAASGKVPEKEPRGSRKAQEEVIDRKLAKPTAIAEPTTKVPSPDELKYITDLQAEVGQTLYLKVLTKHGFKSAADIPDVDKAKAVWKELGGIRKLVVAASHGEILPGIDRAFFDALPEASRASVLVEMRNKIATACGSRDTATEEYENLRANCDGQWELFKALERAHEFYSKQGVA